MTYKALTAVQEADRRRGFVSKMMGWFNAHLPFIVYSEKSDIRRAVEQQLVNRHVFPREQWEATGLPVNRVEDALLHLANQFDWPNHYFLPDDPLALVLQEWSNEFAFDEWLIDLREQEDIAVDRDRIVTLVVRNASLVELMQTLF